MTQQHGYEDIDKGNQKKQEQRSVQMRTREKLCFAPVQEIAFLGDEQEGRQHSDQAAEYGVQGASAIKWKETTGVPPDVRHNGP